MNFNLEAVLLALPILLLSLTAHEWGHAWVALKQGDDTAYMLGRVTMNPAAHVDPVGTLLFPAIAIGTGAPLLGWIGTEFGARWSVAAAGAIVLLTGLSAVIAVNRRSPQTFRQQVRTAFPGRRAAT